MVTAVREGTEVIARDLADFVMQHAKPRVMSKRENLVVKSILAAAIGNPAVLTTDEQIDACSMALDLMLGRMATVRISRCPYFGFIGPDSTWAGEAVFQSAAMGISVKARAYLSIIEPIPREFDRGKWIGAIDDDVDIAPGKYSMTVGTVWMGDVVIGSFAGMMLIEGIGRPPEGDPP